MSNEKTITNFSHFSDAILSELAASVVYNCTGNANFTFTNNALENVTTAATDFTEKLSEITTGGKQSFTLKDSARKNLTDVLQILAMQVNLQAINDLAKLQSSGIPLVQKPTSHVMPVPADLQVKQMDVSGSVLISVYVPKVSHHGTIFAYTLAANAPTTPNDWKQTHANGHSLTINGLIPGSNYQFAAAYKGKDTDDLIWCPAITKMVV